jgi:hypothetical protein
MIKVPIKLVAASTTSCNNNVGFGVVSDDLIQSVLLIFQVQVPFLSCCGPQLIQRFPAVFTRHSLVGFPSAHTAYPLGQAHHQTLLPH